MTIRNVREAVIYLSIIRNVTHCGSIIFVAESALFGGVRLKFPTNATD